MKLLRAAAFITVFVGGTVLFGSGWATTPLPPPAQLFEATDLTGNPVTANFYLTGGGGLMQMVQSGSGYRPNSWFGPETDWTGHQVDRGGHEMLIIGQNPVACSEPFADATPFPANTNQRWPDQLHVCTLVSPSLSGFIGGSFHPPSSLPAVFGAVAPLSISTPNGPLVFHDWEVVDPNSGQCRTGNMGVRAIPAGVEFRGLGPSFAEGVEQRLSMQNADGSVTGKFRAVYAPASPDVSAPLITVDSPRDCMQIPRNAGVTVSFACRDLGTGMSSCAATQGPANGVAINTAQYGDFSLTIAAVDVAGNTRFRTVRYSVVDATPPAAAPVILTPMSAYGWYNHPQIAWNWSDEIGGFGLDAAQCTQTSTVVAEGAAAVATATCRDLAGNVGSASVTLAVDNTPPGPLTDSEDRVVPNPVVQNQPAQGLSPNWADDLSGMASVDCAPVATAVAGQQNAACTGTDRAGNTRTRLIPYTIVAPTGEMLFWHEQNVSPTINRVNVDGTGRMSFDLEGATSIAANATNLFYIVPQPILDAALGRRDLDGTNALVTNGASAAGIETSRAYVYLRNFYHLRRIYPDLTDASGDWNNTPIGVFTADDAFLYFAWGNQIVRSKSDGSEQLTIATVESDPRDLAKGGGFIYWVDSVDGHVGRVKTDGTGFVEHLINVNANALAVSSAYVFWSNAGATTIGRARLNGTAVQSSFITAAGANIGSMAIGGAPLPNHAPLASGGAISTNEDIVLTGTLSASDADDDGLTFSIVGAASKGTAVITDPTTGAFSYTPNLNVNGTDTFTFKANDGTADSNVATVTVTIAPVNDAPVPVAAAFTTREETPFLGAVQAVDPEGQPLQYRFVGNGAKGFAFMLNPATGAFVYLPLPNATGTDQVQFVATDGALDSIPGVLTITITPVNDAPVAQALTVTTHVNTPVTQQLPATDVDGDALTFTITSQPSKGTVTATATGLFTYTPKKNSNGNDTFTFKVTDPSGASSTATVTVNIVK